LTTSAPDEELENGIVLCEVRSWLTGNRLVSLPFSDHCDALVDDDWQFHELCLGLLAERQAGSWKYVELRPWRSVPREAGQFERQGDFCLHTLDLRPEVGELYRGLHRNSIQRKVERAVREELVCHEGNDERTLKLFYGLVVRTRRRQGVPTQPFAWFRNLAEHMGASMTLRIASQQGQPVAGILTLHHGRTVVYKYGASDVSSHRTGCVPFLFWRTIEASRAAGNTLLDLGRTNGSNEGLLRFKDRLGAARTTVTYRRCQPGRAHSGVMRGWFARCGAEALRRLPESVGAITGRLLYRHAG
jgi:hypothetical protein